ncbi:hypothetical protein BUALT_Bualt11G0011600 [Buddleja alternifolia]|uniref:Uncharacterized protein n=1 Tax=Buddleja alternifolia TaxID=168488 RepID=A0AAV6WRP7_9LAMI|nr:hypothetical protein BUALT_Bualt11G0011600 [Buddleja alternifolia]
MRREEICIFVESIKQDAREGVSIDLSTKISSSTAEMSCRMVFGRKYKDKDFNEKGFKHVLKEVMKLFVAPNLGEYFPVLQKFDLQ